MATHYHYTSNELEIVRLVLSDKVELTGGGKKVYMHRGIVKKSMNWYISNKTMASMQNVRIVGRHN